MKYPYIGIATDGTAVLFSAKKTGARIAGDGISELFGYSNCWNENAFVDAGHHYLANSYGKCESQEHADFICKLAENGDFNICSDYSYSRVMRRMFFCFYRGYLYFFNGSLASDEGRKLITLPLPPSKKEIPSTQVIESEQVSQFPKMEVDTPMPQVKSPKQEKPVYTKEMYERGERPPIGSDAILRYKFDSKTVEHRGCILFVSDRNIILEINGRDSHFKACEYVIEPIQTIEDELLEDIAKYFDSYKKHCKALVDELLEKYNITPKEK